MKDQNTQIYLNTPKPYRREYGDCITRIAKRADFASLFDGRDRAEVFLTDNRNYKKYVSDICRLGFVPTLSTQYDMFTFKIVFERLV